MPLEQGWFGGEFQQVVRKGESFKPDEDVEVRDTVVENIQETQPPPPPPAKPKTKVKTKSTTPATKTNTTKKTKS